MVGNGWVVRGAGNRSDPEWTAPGRRRRAPQENSPGSVAANGDIAIEVLLTHLARRGASPFGLVKRIGARPCTCSSRAKSQRRAITARAAPDSFRPTPGVRPPRGPTGWVLPCGVESAFKTCVSSGVGDWRAATAGVRQHLDCELVRQEAESSDGSRGRADFSGSGRDVVCAVARGEADIGLASAAWTRRVGLEFALLRREPYGLVFRASTLGDPRIVRLCEVVQSTEFRREMATVYGYQAGRTGVLSFEPLQSVISHRGWPGLAGQASRLPRITGKDIMIKLRIGRSNKATAHRIAHPFFLSAALATGIAQLGCSTSNAPTNGIGSPADGAVADAQQISTGDAQESSTGDAGDDSTVDADKRLARPMRRPTVTSSRPTAGCTSAPAKQCTGHGQ